MAASNSESQAETGNTARRAFVTAIAGAAWPPTIWGCRGIAPATAKPTGNSEHLL